MPKITKTAKASADRDVLVPDPEVAAELGTTTMSMYRWDRDPNMIALDWPPRIKIGNRNFRSRRAVEAFKEAMVKRAVLERQKLMAGRAKEVA